ncbi:MAG TPA: sulfotransferase [Candidatus Binataceae bacterium]|nr:sulfotransferase [Candidatus Binataceae bacterium]
MIANDKLRGSGRGRLPDFLLVGPPRTGTTWLHGVLYHRACLPERTKETHFFDMFYYKGLNWYRAYFRRCHDEALAGEVTPTYFSLPQVRERIARDLPGCKIVCTLRDPVARAWSWYRVLHREGRIRTGFEDAIVNGSEPQLREANRYAFHLRAWRERFGAGNVGVFFHDDLVADPQRFADSLLDFLGLPPVVITPAVAAHLMRNEANSDCRIPALAYRAWRLRIRLKSMRADGAVARLERLGLWRFCFGGGGSFAPLAPQAETRLRTFFTPEVEALEELLGRDLSAWKLPSPVLTERIAVRG